MSTKAPVCKDVRPMRVCCLQPLGKGPGWAEERQGVSQLRPWPATFVPPLVTCAGAKSAATLRVSFPPELKRPRAHGHVGSGSFLSGFPGGGPAGWRCHTAAPGRAGSPLSLMNQGGDPGTSTCRPVRVRPQTTARLWAAGRVWAAGQAPVGVESWGVCPRKQERRGERERTRARM